jgi:hypothetical protein
MNLVSCEPCKWKLDVGEEEQPSCVELPISCVSCRAARLFLQQVVHIYEPYLSGCHSLNKYLEQLA